MFTGIIESLGKVSSISVQGTNKTFRIQSTLTPELKVDQSVSHNGVCLTVEAIAGHEFQVTAIEETLLRSNIGQWQPGDTVNLERSMLLNTRLDGHIVQGHVDTTAICTAVQDLQGSRQFSFRFPTSFAALVIEKGSISVNGISLTIFNVTDDSFTVAIIPYTLEHTNIKHVQTGSVVNLEFDIIGKYVNRISALNK